MKTYSNYKIISEEKTDEGENLIGIEVNKGFEVKQEYIQFSDEAIKNRDKNRKKGIEKIIKETLERLECVDVNIIKEEEL